MGLSRVDRTHTFVMPTRGSSWVAYERMCARDGFMGYRYRCHLAIFTCWSYACFEDFSTLAKGELDVLEMDREMVG